MIINFLAGPGAGKSTLAAGLFYNLKMHGINCELVREYAKDLAWSGELENTNNEIITGRQFLMVSEMAKNVPLVVHDTSILLGAVYGVNPSYCIQLESQLTESINVFVARSRYVKFQQAGRLQNEAESRAIDDKIIKFLHNRNIDYNTFGRNDLSALTDFVIELMGEGRQ